MSLLLDTSGFDLTSLELRGILTLPDGRRVFVKASRAREPEKRGMQRLLLLRERICLRVLRRLAVPKLVPFSREECRRFFGMAPAEVVALMPIRGRIIDEAGFSPQEILGAWFFVAEQLVAFHRHGLLYTDLKCANLLASRRPPAVTFVDFGYCTPVAASGVYASHLFGITPGFQAPEQGSARVMTERSVVFQLGLLLPHVWFNMGNNTLEHPHRGLERLRRELRRAGAECFWPLVSSCLSAEPKERPKDYETVLREIQALTRDGAVAPAVEHWKRLRAPYADYLARGGL